MQEGKAQAGLWADSPSFVVAAHELKAPLALIRQLAIELESGEYTALERAVLANYTDGRKGAALDDRFN